MINNERRDLQAKLEKIVTRLQDDVVLISPRLRSQARDELFAIVLELKHIIDFDLAPPVVPHPQASADYRVIYCEKCGTAYMRRPAPEIRCGAGHRLFFDD